MRYPYEVNLVGDAKATLQTLIPLLQHKADRAWREQIESDVAAWWNTVERRAMTDADLVNPLRIFHELSKRLPPNAIVAADSGSAANWYARLSAFHRRRARIAVRHARHDGTGRPSASREAGASLIGPRSRWSAMARCR